MDLGLQDKTVIVTGGASGIGEAIVRTFAEESASVVIADRDAGRGSTLAGSLQSAGLNVVFIHTELTEESSIRHLMVEVKDRFGALDVIVNNAAVNDGAGIESGLDAFRKSLEINLVAPYAVVHHGLDMLRAAGGVIINIGSKVADTGQGGTNGYAAGKGGLKALTREWAVDLSKHAIRVNTVVPAEVWTPQYERWLEEHASDPEAARREIDAFVPLGGRMTTTLEIADMVAFLSSRRAGHVTGQIVYVDGGYTHLDRAMTVRRKHL
jgi:NAD(P)-dependent dehydrogenase (short-subunit alcohol dehydrogenase family)